MFAPRERFHHLPHYIHRFKRPLSFDATADANSTQASQTSWSCGANADDLTLGQWSICTGNAIGYQVPAETSFTVQAVPEPAASLLLATRLLALAILARKRKAQGNRSCPPIPNQPGEKGKGFVNLI